MDSAASAMEFRREVFEARPRPTPSPSETTTAPSGSVTELIYAAASEFGLDGGYLLSVATCESGLNPGAYNPAGYHGLFQFDQTTWAAYGYGSIYDPAAQARTAARLLAAGQSSRWPNCA
jgi:soluble lytic murein transglycosylase-like protein